jgi:hypothetical protein
LRCDVEGSAPKHGLKINVTASVNQLLRDGSMPICGSDEERRAPIPFLKINVTASVNQLLRDGSMPICGRAVERRCPTRVLGVDQGQRACRRQERPNSHCIAMTGSIMNVEHSFAFFFRGLREGLYPRAGMSAEENELSQIWNNCVSLNRFNPAATVWYFRGSSAKFDRGRAAGEDK